MPIGTCAGHKIVYRPSLVLSDPNPRQRELHLNYTHEQAYKSMIIKVCGSDSKMLDSIHDFIEYPAHYYSQSKTSLPVRFQNNTSLLTPASP